MGCSNVFSFFFVVCWVERKMEAFVAPGAVRDILLLSFEAEMGRIDEPLVLLLSLLIVDDNGLR